MDHSTSPQDKSDVNRQVYGCYETANTDDNDEHDVSVSALQDLRANNIPSLSCAFLASLTTGGITYAFGLYGAALKQSLHLTQGQLDTISSANFCAGLLSWLPGLCVDRFGPRFSMSTGGITGALSLLFYWAVAKKYILISQGWVVIVLSLLGVTSFLSSAMVTGSVFKIIVTSSGPGTKGSAVGVAKGYVGLGAGAYATLFQRIRTEYQSDLDFLPMAAFFAVFAATIPALMLLPHYDRTQVVCQSHNIIDAATPLHFQTLYASLTAMAILVIGNSLMQLYHAGPAVVELETRNEKGEQSYVMSLLVVAVWFGPILSLMFLPPGNHNLNESLPPTASAEDEEEEQILDSNGADAPQETGHGTTEIRSASSSYARVSSSDEDVQASLPCFEEGVTREDPVAPRELNPLQMLQTLPAWCFLWTATILVGSGTVMTNNMGQMVEALHFPAIVAPSALALFSVAQAASRVATGSLSEAAMSWKVGVDGSGVSRPVFLIIASVSSAIAHAILGLAAREGPFVVGVALSGAAFGMVWPLMVLIVGEVFGASYIASNYLIYDGCTSAAGTLLLSKFVAQDVYESHITPGGDGVTCYGLGCFSLSHFIVAGLALTSIITSVGVLLTTRDVYRNGRTSYAH